MDQDRMRIIESGNEYMSLDLLTSIEKFKSYEKSERPVVTILCTDKRLLSQMDKLSKEYSNIDFYVCGTFDGIDDAMEKIELSDAVIANTLALKIAPEGLYSVLKSIGDMQKDVYFILSGWESLPKDVELAEKKKSQVDIEFPFSRIKTSVNVFAKQADGFLYIEDVMRDYLNSIDESYSFTHEIQVEAAFKRIRKKILKFRECVCLDIQNEESLLMQLHQDLIAKKDRYKITFSHATVYAIDALERLERIVRTVDVDELLCAIETDDLSARERFIAEPNKIERETKIQLYNLYCKSISSFMESELGANCMENETSLRVDQLVEELVLITGRIKQCRFITQKDIDELDRRIRNTDVLSDSASSFDESIITVIKRVLESLRAKILEFEFEIYKQGEIEKYVDKVLTISSKELTDREEINEEGLAEINNENTDETERVQEKKWKSFYAELQRLISYSKNALSGLISENVRITNSEIDNQSVNSVSKYFCSITEMMNQIIDNLKKQYNEFERVDL